MSRTIHRLNHFVGRHIGKWAPAALLIGIVLACAAHKRDTPRFVVPITETSSVIVRG